MVPEIFFSRSISHNFISVQNCTEPRPILNSSVRPWCQTGILVYYILNRRIFHLRNRKSPCFFSKAIISKETQGKWTYLWKDCLLRKEPGERYLYLDLVRPYEACWEISAMDWDHLLKNRFLCFLDSGPLSVLSTTCNPMSLICVCYCLLTCFLF